MKPDAGPPKDLGVDLAVDLGADVQAPKPDTKPDIRVDTGQDIEEGGCSCEVGHEQSSPSIVVISILLLSSIWRKNRYLVFRHLRKRS